jgi:hypothetical protein
MSNTSFFMIAIDYRQQVEQLMDLQDDEQTIADTVESLQWPVEVKAENCMFVVRDCQFKLQALDSEIERLSAMRERVAKKETDLRSYVHLCMEAAGIQKIMAGTFNLALQKNPASVEILDERQIPAAYMRTPEPKPVVPAPDKKAILAALKLGEDIPGAKLAAEKTRLVVK